MSDQLTTLDSLSEKNKIEKDKLLQTESSFFYTSNQGGNFHCRLPHGHSGPCMPVNSPSNPISNTHT